MATGCAICHDTLTAQVDVVGTKCGHIYHKQCMEQWIRTSKTCPTCRNRCLLTELTRIYLSPMGDGEADGRVSVSVRDKLQVENSKLKEEIANMKKTVDESVKKRDDMAQMVSTLDALHKKDNFIIRMYQKQLGDYEMQKARAESLAIEMNQLRGKVDQMKTIEAMISSSAEEVEHIISTQCSKTLAVLVVNLKRELRNAETRKNEMRTTNQNLNSAMKMQADKIEALQDQIKAFESDLFNRNRMEMAEIVEPSPPTRFSMGAIKKTRVNSIDFDTTRIAPAAAKPDSPYLRLQSSSVGLTPIMRTGVTYSREQRPLNDNLQRLSIFQAARISKNATARIPNRFGFESSRLPSIEQQENYEPVSTNSKLIDRFNLDTRHKRAALKRPHNNINIMDE